MLGKLVGVIGLAKGTDCVIIDGGIGRINGGAGRAARRAARLIDAIGFADGRGVEIRDEEMDCVVFGEAVGKMIDANKLADGTKVEDLDEYKSCKEIGTELDQTTISKIGAWNRIGGKENNSGYR